MSLYTDWENKRKQVSINPQEEANFWKDYFRKETDVYKKLLAEKEFKIKGTVKEITEKFELEPFEFFAFLDGINTSLNNQLGDLNDYDLDSEIELDINPEKLLYNMHVAKADWLYNLQEWNDIFSKEKQKEIEEQYHYGRTIRKPKKIGRNDPCPCGSGKKYKNCCGRLNRVGA